MSVQCAPKDDQRRQQQTALVLGSLFGRLLVLYAVLAVQYIPV